ncbi:hypothetical protein FACS189491_10160 [Spirochaetia bacterium]|nr:hypothetical protein FACS189491_10160 [Spirochaetia bacterium]
MTVDTLIINPYDIELRGSFFVTRMKSNGKYKRKVRYYDKEFHHTYEFITNNFTLTAQETADIYKARWQVELFFKWIKQHLKIKSFWGTSENAV